MPAPVTIPAQPARPVSEDFQALRAEALGWLETWCHEEWTDFNLHDPGITVLEQLCYALTDLGLRTTQPVPVLLGASAAGADREKNCLFAPERILPMSPLTANDYQAWLLDRHADVLAVRFAPRDSSASPRGFALPGQNVVSVLLDPDLTDDTRTPVRLRELQEDLNRHRNLGERFEPLQALRIDRFALHGRLRIANGHSAERVLADLYLSVRRALLPIRELPPLAELESHDAAPTTLLTGPLLGPGRRRVPLEPLEPPRHSVEQRVLAALRRTPGLAAFEVEFAFPETLADAPPAMAWLARAFTVASTDLPPDPNRNGFRLEPASASTAFDPRRVEEAIRLGLQSPDRRATSVRSGVSPGVSLPSPLPRVDLQTFEPIGNGLPRIYGLGPHQASPGNDDPARLASARQLLGYLMGFEQLAANLAAQLAHVGDLFSTDPQSTTDFAQPLYGIPGAFALFKGFPDLPPNLSGPERAAHETAYRDDPHNPYWHGLQDLVNPPRRFRERRERFLDHLLARFGEEYPPTDLATWETAANKERLLRRLPALGFRRAAARDRSSTQPAGPTGLEERIALLLSRDDDATTLPGTEFGRSPGPADPAPRRGSFHFLIEHVLFVPEAPPAARPGDLPMRVELDALRGRITHVILNWTVQPLNPPFQRYTENLIRQHLGAHLDPVFLWFERTEFAPPEAQRERDVTHQMLDALTRDWMDAGCPALRLLATPEGDSITVNANDVAGRLFSRLIEATQSPRIRPEQ